MVDQAQLDAPRPRVRRWLAAAAVALLCAAVFRRSGCGAGDQNDPLVNTPTHFRSVTGIAVEVKAPPGWRLEFEPDPGAPKVFVIEGKLPMNQAPRSLTIMTTRIEGRADLAQILEGLRAAMNLTWTAPQRGEVKGKPSLSMLGLNEKNGSTVMSTMVARGQHLVVSLDCVSSQTLDPRQACADAMASLTFLGPDD